VHHNIALDTDPSELDSSHNIALDTGPSELDSSHYVALDTGPSGLDSSHNRNQCPGLNHQSKKPGKRKKEKERFKAWT
jgi:hypothetical protein